MIAPVATREALEAITYLKKSEKKIQFLDYKV